MSTNIPAPKTGPGPRDLRAEARRWVRRKRILYTILGIYAVLSLMWFTIDMADGTESLWFYWPMLGVGIGVAITAVVLFGVGGLLGTDWERRQIERYIEQHDGAGTSGSTRARPRAVGDRRVTVTDSRPVNLTQALGSFDDVYSPRIVARMNDYDVRIAHAKGEHVWHVHDDTDEFFLVLAGRLDIALRRSDGSEASVALSVGDTFVVPRGTTTSHRRPVGRSFCSSRPEPPRPGTATRARSPARWTAQPATSCSSAGRRARMRLPDPPIHVRRTSLTAC